MEEICVEVIDADLILIRINIIRIILSAYRFL